MSALFEKLLGEDDGEEAGPHELRRLRVGEVSLVPRAANRREFLMWKSDGETEAKWQNRICLEGLAYVESLEAQTRSNDKPRGGDSMPTEREKEARMRELVKSADFPVMFESIIRKGFDSGEIKLGDGQVSGLYSAAMAAGYDPELLLRLPPDVRGVYRADLQAGRNTYMEKQAEESMAIARAERLEKTDGASGSASSEIMRLAKGYVEKDVTGRLDLADAIIKVRAERPDLAQRLRQETLGY